VFPSVIQYQCVRYVQKDELPYFTGVPPQVCESLDKISNISSSNTHTHTHTHAHTISTTHRQ